LVDVGDDDDDDDDDEDGDDDDDEDNDDDDDSEYEHWTSPLVVLRRRTFGQPLITELNIY